MISTLNSFKKNKINHGSRDRGFETRISSRVKKQVLSLTKEIVIINIEKMEVWGEGNNVK